MFRLVFVAVMQIVVELYYLLEKVNRESQHMFHIDTICDFLYPFVCRNYDSNETYHRLTYRQAGRKGRTDNLHLRLSCRRIVFIKKNERLTDRQLQWGKERMAGF